MNDFVGNNQAIKYIEDSVVSGNLSHAYLFCGPGNVGKTKAGKYLARLLLCESGASEACDSCHSCKLFATGNHPDFFHLDSTSVLVDEIRELVSSLELKSYFGTGKVALISHAENLTNQALNSLLKTLEEPNAKTTIILTTENQQNLLATIVSRTRSVNFGLVSDKGIYELLNGELNVLSPRAKLITSLSAGRPGVATVLSQNEGAVEEAMQMSKDFNRIYKSTDTFEKISFADKLSKDKETLVLKLASLELGARAELLSKNLKNNKEDAERQLILLDGIAKSREMLAANANAKLVMEGLMLRSIA